MQAAGKCVAENLWELIRGSIALFLRAMGKLSILHGYLTNAAGFFIWKWKRLFKERRERMAANVESMFYVREAPWHGLGTKVMSAPSSEDALRLAGLDWKGVQEPIYV